MPTDGAENRKTYRRLAAIFAADIAGYSALMGADEAASVRSLKEHQAVVLPMITEHGGRIIDTAGDGILAEFGSVVNAVECSVVIQRVMAQRNADVEEARRMRFRIGVLSIAGHTLAVVAGELDDAGAFQDQALLINPNLALAWAASGWAKVWLGEPDQAVERFARAMRLTVLIHPMLDLN